MGKGGEKGKGEGKGSKGKGDDEEEKGDKGGKGGEKGGKSGEKGGKDKGGKDAAESKGGDKGKAEKGSKNAGKGGSKGKLPDPGSLMDEETAEDIKGDLKGKGKGKIKGKLQEVLEGEEPPVAEADFEDTLMEVLQERRRAMYPELQVRYVFDAVDDALNPHYEGLVRRYAGRIRDFEGKCVSAEKQHKAWIKDRYELGQEVEGLEKKVREERERANQFSTVAANNSLRLMTGKSIPKGQLNAIKMVGAGGLDVNVQHLEKDIGKLDIDIGTTRFKTLQSIINSIYWRLPQTRDITYIASHYGESCGAFFRFHSTLLLISVITLACYSPLLVMQLIDYWSLLGVNWKAVEGNCEVVSIVFSAAAAALALENRSTFGRKITSPLLSFFIGWMLRSKVLPFVHPMYDVLSSSLLPAALPLMVLSAQLRPRSTSRARHNLQLLLAAFIVASIASCGGALLAFTVVRVLQPSWLPLPLSSVSKVCGCLTATYIGGSANLAEVAWETGLAKNSQGILGCLAAADVLLMCFYFAALTLVAKAYGVGQSTSTTFDTSPAPFGRTTRRGLLDDLKKCVLHVFLGIAAMAMVFLSNILAVELHCAAASRSAIAVALAVVVAQSLRRWMSSQEQMEIGKSCAYVATLFLGCFYTTLGIGAASGIAGAGIFFLSTLVLLGHLVLTYVGCQLINLACGRRLIRLPIFLVASNAAVGGPSTASTFAESLQLTELVVPAAVCGTLGYALGTPVAFVLMKCFMS
eukprot:symbB.v1.2.035529.t2/scaffold4806.1/size34549/3